MKHRLAYFLLKYRTTPHRTTGATPAELLMRRRLRMFFKCSETYLAQVIVSKQSKQKDYLN